MSPIQTFSVKTQNIKFTSLNHHRFLRIPVIRRTFYTDSYFPRIGVLCNRQMRGFCLEHYKRNLFKSSSQSLTIYHILVFNYLFFFPKFSKPRSDTESLIAKTRVQGYAEKSGCFDKYIEERHKEANGSYIINTMAAYGNVGFEIRWLLTGWQVA